MKKLVCALFVFIFCGFLNAHPAAFAGMEDGKNLFIRPEEDAGWEAAFRQGRPGFSLICRGGGGAEESVKFVPLDSAGNPGEITGVSRLSNPGGAHDSVEIEISFREEEALAEVSFIGAGIAEIRPVEGISSLRIESDIRYGFLPGFFLEDVIYDPERRPEADVLYVPSENVIGGFLGDGNAMLAAAWPEGSQTVSFIVERDENGSRIKSVDIMLSGKEIYAGLLVEEDIWYEIREHEEILENLGYFPDREIPLGWQKPFEARWRTQLLWNLVESCFYFREGRREYLRWHRLYPAWFEDDGQAFIRLTDAGRATFTPGTIKTVVYPYSDHPKSLMSFLERTPMKGHFTELIRSTNPWREPDAEHEVPVGFRACAGTSFFRGTFLKGGIQDREQSLLNSWLDYVLDANRRTHEHRDRYGALTDSIAGYIESMLENEEEFHAAEFLGKMADEAEWMQREYREMIARDGQPTTADYIEYGEKLAERMREIITVPGDEFFAEYDRTAVQFNRIIWHARESTEGFHGGGYAHYLRHWAFEAGYRSKGSYESVIHAEEIRRRIMEFLRARTGYATTAAGS